MLSMVIGSSTQNTWLLMSKVLVSSLYRELNAKRKLITPQKASLLDWIYKNGIVGKSTVAKSERNLHDRPFL